MSTFGMVTGQSNYGEAPSTYGGAIVAAMKSVEANGIQANKDLGQIVLRSERRNSQEGQIVLGAAASQTQQLVEDIINTLSFDTDPSGAEHKSGLKFRQEARGRAMQAAQIGHALAVGYQSIEGRELGGVNVGSNGFLMNSGSLSNNKMRLRQEAFNNIDVRRSVAFSMGFNAAITRQTDVVMAWFPPIFINPDQVSLEISLNLLTVFNGAYHDISGKKTDFMRRNVVRAFADPNVLNRYETQIVPVVRPENVAMFVDAAEIAPAEKHFGNRKVLTAPLKFDTDVNLIGISTTDALLKTGQNGHRDVVEPGVKLASIYFKSDSDIIALKTTGLKTSVFVGAQQGDQFEILLNMRTNVGVGKTLKQYDGTDLAGPLAVLAANDLRLKLHIQASGVVNVETGNAKVQTPSVTLVALVDAMTQEEITSGAVFTAVSNAVKAFEFLGWDPLAFRTNANRRQVGDRINTRRFNYHYVVPYRDPITAERPAHKQEEQDAQDLMNLQALVRIRIENEVIDTIVDTADTMVTFVDMRDTDAEATDILGLAQFYLLPVFVRDNIDMTKYVDSIKSSERARDIQAAIVVKLRDVAARMYTDSQFKAGTDLQSGGTLPAPQINVLTDPILARYIMEPGELRTLGDFEMILTTTLNYKVRGQIFMSFRMPGQESSNEPCIFNFGHLIMSPELVLAANMTREGSYFAETQVQPRYELIVLNPVMAQISVTGVKEVLTKVPGYTTLTDPIKIDGIVEMKTVP